MRERNGRRTACPPQFCGGRPTSTRMFLFKDLSGQRCCCIILASSNIRRQSAIVNKILTGQVSQTARYVPNESGSPVTQASIFLNEALQETLFQPRKVDLGKDTARLAWPNASSEHFAIRIQPLFIFSHVEAAEVF